MIRAFSERLERLGEARAVHLPAVITQEQAAVWTEAVFAARDVWSSDFGGDQFALGHAWYTHLETSRVRQYFRDAAKADQRVERALPGMQQMVRTLIAAFTEGTAAPRPGFCGAGVHVFLPRCPVAQKGGSIHFDLEGLRTDQELTSRALSFVLMLQPAEQGGGLRLWNARYAGNVHPSPSMRKAAYETVSYGVGDAVLFESQRLHQIEPFGGETPRVSITAHALERTPSQWEVWF